MRIDIVHRHGANLLLLAVADGEVRLIVGCCLCALVVDNLETVQTDAEGQPFADHSLLGADQELVGRLASAQMQHTLTCREMGDKRSEQDDAKRQMEHYGRQAAHFSLEEIDYGHSREHSPQQTEPPCTIDMGRDKLCALVFFNNCGGSHHGHHHNI